MIDILLHRDPLKIVNVVISAIAVFVVNLLLVWRTRPYKGKSNKGMDANCPQAPIVTAQSNLRVAVSIGSSLQYATRLARATANRFIASYLPASGNAIKTFISYYVTPLCIGGKLWIGHDLILLNAAIKLWSGSFGYNRTSLFIVT
jgi:hypothetical protein